MSPSSSFAGGARKDHMTFMLREGVHLGCELPQAYSATGSAFLLSNCSSQLSYLQLSAPEHSRWPCCHLQHRYGPRAQWHQILHIHVPQHETALTVRTAVACSSWPTSVNCCYVEEFLTLQICLEEKTRSMKVCQKSGVSLALACLLNFHIQPS